MAGAGTGEHGSGPPAPQRLRAPAVVTAGARTVDVPSGGRHMEAKLD